MGNSYGMNDLSEFYEYGIGVDKDVHKAFFYYQKSADMGRPDGINKVGHCYKKGIGVEKDKNKAFTYYQKSADMGHAKGIYNVGNCYQNRIGVEKDEHKAFTYYQKSADMGHAMGIYKVGYCYEKGIGVEKDKNKAFKYYKKYYRATFVIKMDDKIDEAGIEGFYVRFPRYIPRFLGVGLGFLVSIFGPEDHISFDFLIRWDGNNVNCVFIINFSTRKHHILHHPNNIIHSTQTPFQTFS
ncbi:hypothetical protein C2G38_2048922 [Gigaspora rosea]|uniref:HCP-like protein n=1 Tax=Gigaspora rosea TaxID=44941 RepID=A0A397U0T3_9GLOM|nr:hypothetical protein C2G38_2048922 [Gigaspora rosea]